MTLFKTSFLNAISRICLLFFLNACAIASSSSTVTVSKEHPGSLPVLVSLEQVSRDLHCTSLQRTVIAGLRNDYRTAAMKITEAGRRASSDTAQLQMQLDNLGATYNERVMAILNPSQRRRLREIERQVLGGTLLAASSEQKMLGLTEQQKKKIALLAHDANKKADAINLKATQGKLNYHRQIMALRKNRLQYAKAMLQILTPEQLVTWKRSQGVTLEHLK